MLSHSPPKPGRTRLHRQSPKPYRPRRRRSGGGLKAVTSHFDMPTSAVAPLPFDSFVLRMGRISYDYPEREEQRTLQNEFREHVERWKEDTEHYSSLSKMIIHPSYMRIMGMGPAALPFLFRELKERPDHWFVALNAITGLDAAPPKSTFNEAVSAWLTWGAKRGYLQ